jgi:N-methylhydantoinase B
VAELEAPAVILRSEYEPDTAGPGRFRGGASTLCDVMWLCNAEHRFQQFNSRRPSGGGGVYGGESGALGAAWLWDSEPASRRGLDSLTAPVGGVAYRDAVPLGRMINPVTNEADPNGEYVCVSIGLPASAGAVVRVLTSGGGGWGDPLRRDCDRVLADIRNGYITIEGAARQYGVVATGDPAKRPEGVHVDEVRTEKLRSELRGCRGPVPG